jgi:hypothetical protein
MEEVEVENPNFLCGGDNLQVDLTLLLASLDIDPVLTDNQQPYIFSGRPHLESIIIWSRFFAPIGNPGGIIVPTSWSDFITLVLMDPIRFHWAKSFLESSGWSLVTKDFGSKQSFTFYLPQLCPSQQGISCIEQPVEYELNSPPSVLATPKQKKVCSHPLDDLVNMLLKRNALKGPLVCTEVKRSDRLKELNKGFKASSCNS